MSVTQVDRVFWFPAKNIPARKMKNSPSSPATKSISSELSILGLHEERHHCDADQETDAEQGANARNAEHAGGAYSRESQADSQQDEPGRHALWHDYLYVR
jgi:hypothetical protein